MRNEALIQARKLRGWSQLRVAQQISADPKRVGEWERGEATPIPVYQERLCNLFGTDAASLGFIAHPESSRWADESLTIYSRGILNLHDLYFKGYPYHVETILPVYVRQASALVQPGPLSKEAATVASKAYLLACELASDREDFGIAQQAGKQALRYGQIAGDRNLQVAALIGLANVGFHRRQSASARHSYQQAISLFDASVTPLLKGRAYAGIAEVYAMRSETQEALRAMGMAYEVYPMIPEDDPAYPYIHASRYALYMFGETQSRLFLNQPREAEYAMEALQREQNTDAENEPVTKLDLRYYQAESRWQQGELEGSIFALEEAAKLARHLGSRLYFNKLVEIYRSMLAQWPQEPKIIRLEEVFETGYRPGIETVLF